MRPFLRVALSGDVPRLRALIARSARVLSVGFYTQPQIEAVTREVFGVDSQLVADGTYYAVEQDGEIVACGGWGKRSTGYGGDQAKSKPERLLDPSIEAAKARRGLGSMLMSHCAAEAEAAGFARLELVATMPGVPLYEALGFAPVERFDLALSQGTVMVPVLLMRR